VALVAAYTFTVHYLPLVDVAAGVPETTLEIEAAGHHGVHTTPAALADELHSFLA
jgi:hypothetical protein